MTLLFAAAASWYLIFAAPSNYNGVEYSKPVGPFESVAQCRQAYEDLASEINIAYMNGEPASTPRYRQFHSMTYTCKKMKAPK